MAERKPDLTTQADVAKAFGVSTRTIREWVAQGMPGSRGAYCFAEILAWRDARREAQREKESEYSNLQAEWKRTQIKLAQQRLEIQAGRLLDIDDAHRWMSIIAAAYRAAGERLIKEFGEPARVALEEALAGAQDEIDRIFPGE